MKIAMVAQRATSTSGTGQYAERLTAAFPDELTADTVTLPVDSVVPFPFIAKALDGRLTDADLVHIQFDYVVFGPLGLFTLLFFPLVAARTRLAGVPLVVTLHETLGSQQVAPPLRPLKRWYLRLLNETVSRSVDHLIFLSEAAHDRFSVATETCSERMTIFSHGVPEPQCSTSRSAAKRYFGVDPTAALLVAPGYVSPRKGSDVFVDAAERLPDRSFLLAGGAPRPAHKSFAAELADRSPPNCTVTGQLPEAAFQTAFVAADLIVLPYQETEQRGIINPVSQSGVFNCAAAYEVPVLAADCAHFRALADKWGTPALFTSGDPTALATAATSLLNNQPRRRQLAEAMSTYRAANELSTVAHRHHRLYQAMTAP